MFAGIIKKNTLIKVELTLGEGFSRKGINLLENVDDDTFRATENIIAFGNAANRITNTNVITFQDLRFFTEEIEELHSELAFDWFWNNNLAEVPDAARLVQGWYPRAACWQAGIKSIIVPGGYLPLLPQGWVVIPAHKSRGSEFFILTEKKWREIRHTVKIKNSATDLVTERMAEYPTAIKILIIKGWGSGDAYAWAFMCEDPKKAYKAGSGYVSLIDITKNPDAYYKNPHEDFWRLSDPIAGHACKGKWLDQTFSEEFRGEVI